MTSCFYFPLAWINWVPLILSIYFFAGIDSLINRKWPSSELFPSLVKESVLLGEYLDLVFSLCMCLYLCVCEFQFSPHEQFYGGKSFGVCVYQTKQLWLSRTPKVGNIHPITGTLTEQMKRFISIRMRRKNLLVILKVL